MAGQPVGGRYWILVIGAPLYVAIVLRKEPVAVSQDCIVPFSWEVRRFVVVWERVRESVACDCVGLVGEESVVDVVLPDLGAQRDDAGGWTGVVPGVLMLFIELGE